jgi:hypothetical protein
VKKPVNRAGASSLGVWFMSEVEQSSSIPLCGYLVQNEIERGRPKASQNMEYSSDSEHDRTEPLASVPDVTAAPWPHLRPTSLVHDSLLAVGPTELMPMPLVTPPSHRRSRLTPVVGPVLPSLLSSVRPLDTPCSAPPPLCFTRQRTPWALGCTVVEMAVHGHSGAPSWTWP